MKGKFIKITTTLIMTFFMSGFVACKQDDFASKGTEMTALLGLLMPMEKTAQCGRPTSQLALFMYKLGLDNGPWDANICKPKKAVYQAASLNTIPLGTAQTNYTSERTFMLGIQVNGNLGPGFGSSTVIADYTYTKGKVSSVVSTGKLTITPVTLLDFTTITATGSGFDLDNTKRNPIDPTTGCPLAYVDGSALNAAIATATAGLTDPTAITDAQQAVADQYQKDNTVVVDVVETKTYTYDANGDLADVTTTSTCGGNASTISTKTTYTYDSKHRPLTISSHVNESVTTSTFKIFYDAAATMTYSVLSNTIVASGTKPLTITTFDYTNGVVARTDRFLAKNVTVWVQDIAIAPSTTVTLSYTDTYTVETGVSSSKVVTVTDVKGSLTETGASASASFTCNPLTVLTNPAVIVTYPSNQTNTVIDADPICGGAFGYPNSGASQATINAASLTQLQADTKATTTAYSFTGEKSNPTGLTSISSVETWTSTGNIISQTTLYGYDDRSRIVEITGSGINPSTIVYDGAGLNYMGGTSYIN